MIKVVNVDTGAIVAAYPLYAGDSGPSKYSNQQIREKCSYLITELNHFGMARYIVIDTGTEDVSDVIRTEAT